ncbi:13390e93-fb8e-478a-a58f-5756acf193de [Sclerotinia trifoliorum]|uniref:Phosphoribosylglycinamide formyltransferase n=1 Tax=Sclerotinia trifoliorum TaxID=28548 RepID=A0A8H2W0U5_9HELO|nr:13390e93-fb8e-478a-a58f-5756acf193de [Sclerotinia trifoliorum]
MSPPPTKATVLISGTGTNLQALIDASQGTNDAQPTMPYLNIIRVISNRKGVEGLKKAERAHIPTTYHNLLAGKYHKKDERDPAVIQAAREKYDADLADLVIADQPDIIICAGWMHILAPTFIDPLTAKEIPIINLHPALPGKYDGANAIKRAHDDFELGRLENNRTGIMIHYVISEVDRGTPILVIEVECKSSETLEKLEARMHEVEHKLIVEGSAMAIKELWAQRSSVNA